MAFNPFGALKNILSSAVGGIPVIGGLAKSLIDKIDTETEKMTPEQRLALQNSVRAAEIESFKLVLADSADMRKLAMAELEHPGIKWVRPGILAGLFLIVVFWTVVAPLLKAAGLDIAPPDLSALPDQLWWLFGSAYLGYGTMREIGKKNKLGAK